MPYNEAISKLKYWFEKLDILTIVKFFNWRRNTPLFYIYNDGIVEKRITID